MTVGLAGGVETQLVDAQTDNFLVEQSVTLGGGGAQLALQGILVLSGAADSVAPRHDFRGFQHRNVGAGHAVQYGFGLGAIAVLVLGLGQ